MDMDEHDEIPYQRRESIKPGHLREALANLQFLGDDPFLRMQAMNLDIVDQFLTDLEYEVLRELHQEGRTPLNAFFLNAQSQMWIFAVYELIRTWKERSKDIIKWAKNGGLQHKLAHLELEQEGFLHFGREARIEQLKAVIADPKLLQLLGRQLKHIHIQYERLTYIRVSLAKHQVSGKAKSIAPNPGYGRINMWCGSLDYAMEDGQVHRGTISRRDIADGLRALRLEGEPPSDEDLFAFDEFMKATPPADFPLDDKPGPTGEVT
jgi:hypothetical protein